MTTISPSLVYQHVLKMMEYRELIVPEPNQAKMLKDLEQSTFHIIYSSRKATNRRREINCAIVLIAAGSDIAKTISDFKGLCTSIRGEAPFNLIFITENPFSSSVHKEILRMKAQGMGSILAAKLRIETCYHKDFVCDKTAYCMYVPHEIMSPEEVAEFKRITYAIIEELPILEDTDPVALWLGIEPGQIVRITRLSDNAGMSIIYKRCVKK